MLQSVINVLKGSLRPSSILMCLLLVLVGVLLLYMRGGTKVGRRWLIAVIAGYWAISTPLGARLLMRGLIGDYTPVQNASEVPAASAIVVLSGGSFTYRTGGLALDVLSEPTALRALEAARLYRLLGDPLVVASGGAVFPAANPDPESQALGKALVSLGVPPQRIVYESLSRNTLEQAAAVEGHPAGQAYRSFRARDVGCSHETIDGRFQGRGPQPVPVGVACEIGRVVGRLAVPASGQAICFFQTTPFTTTWRWATTGRAAGCNDASTDQMQPRRHEVTKKRSVSCCRRCINRAAKPAHRSGLQPLAFLPAGQPDLEVGRS